LTLTFPQIPLPIAVIQPSFRTLLMFLIGAAALLTAGFLAALITAIAVSPIARPAEVEDSPATFGKAKPLPEKDFGNDVHPHPIADWTSGIPSCEA
jgi:hypothetical protein